MQVTPATTYDSISAGPAVLCAAAPVATKMPAPITAPMPSAVRGDRSEHTPQPMFAGHFC